MALDLLETVWRSSCRSSHQEKGPWAVWLQETAAPPHPPLPGAPSPYYVKKEWDFACIARWAILKAGHPEVPSQTSPRGPACLSNWEPQYSGQLASGQREPINSRYMEK